MSYRRFFSLCGTSESISEGKIELRLDVGAFDGVVFGKEADGEWYVCGYRQETDEYMYVTGSGFIRAFSKERFEAQLNELAEAEGWE